MQAIIEPYKTFITPILKDKGLEQATEIGILMCGSPIEELGTENSEPKWTVFVSTDWLRWFLEGQAFGRGAIEIPGQQIYGQVPAWPDGFFEFLAAIVMTEGVFIWRRHPNGYLVLCQPT